MLETPSAFIYPGKIMFRSTILNEDDGTKSFIPPEEVRAATFAGKQIDLVTDHLDSSIKGYATNISYLDKAQAQSADIVFLKENMNEQEIEYLRSEKKKELSIKYNWTKGEALPGMGHDYTKNNIHVHNVSWEFAGRCGPVCSLDRQGKGTSYTGLNQFEKQEQQNNQSCENTMGNNEAELKAELKVTKTALDTAEAKLKTVMETLDKRNEQLCTYEKAKADKVKEEITKISDYPKEALDSLALDVLEGMLRVLNRRKTADQKGYPSGSETKTGPKDYSVDGIYDLNKLREAPEEVKK